MAGLPEAKSWIKFKLVAELQSGGYALARDLAALSMKAPSTAGCAPSQDQLAVGLELHGCLVCNLSCLRWLPYRTCACWLPHRTNVFFFPAFG